MPSFPGAGRPFARNVAASLGIGKAEPYRHHDLGFLVDLGELGAQRDHAPGTGVVRAGQLRVCAARRRQATGLTRHSAAGFGLAPRAGAVRARLGMEGAHRLPGETLWDRASAWAGSMASASA